MPDMPYLKWPLFRCSLLAGFGCPVTLSPSRLAILDEVGGESLGRLDGEAEAIIRDGETPAHAATRLAQLRARIAEFLATASATVTSFRKLGIAIEDTPADQAEVELRVPDPLLKGNLRGLARESGALERILGDIGEAATGIRPTLELRSLGTGSAEIVLVVDPITGAAILTVVTAIVQLINALLETRKHQAALEKQRVPKEVLEALAAWEQQRVTTQLEELRKELLAANKVTDKPRKNELDNALKTSLKQLADKVDRGLDIDVSVAPDDAGDTNGTESGDTKAGSRSDAVKRIQDNSRIILTLERGPEPVLMLGSGGEDTDTPAPPTAPEKKKKAE